MTYVVFNNGGLGDCFVGSTLCTLIKQKFPDKKTAFIMGKNSFDIIGEVIKLQDNIDYVGYEEGGQIILSEKIDIEKIYLQGNYYTDLSFYQSLMIGFINDYGLPNNAKIQTYYKLDTAKVLPRKLTIAVNDISDWKRKRKYDLELKDKVENLLRTKYKADIIEIGIDNKLSYLDNLRILNNCHLYLGFFGSLSTFAAGIGVDTITYPTVMPPSWASASFYASGWHKHVLVKPENHCKQYKCVIPRPYYFPRSEPTNIQGKFFANFSGPPIIEDHNDIFGETCRHTSDNRSCISKMTIADIDDQLQIWLDNRWNS